MAKKPRIPKYRIVLTVEAANINSVESKLKQLFGEATVQKMKKLDLPNTRQERLDAAQGLVEDAKNEVEELQGELQDWYDNLPESFQSGDQGEALQEAIDGLGEIETSLEDIDFSGFSGFPGMRG